MELSEMESKAKRDMRRRAGRVDQSDSRNDDGFGSESGPSNESGSASGRQISSRQSLLTRILGPLLTQNTKTFLALSVHADSHHYSTTSQMLRLACRAQSITTACARLEVRVQRVIGLLWACYRPVMGLNPSNPFKTLSVNRQIRYFPKIS